VIGSNDGKVKQILKDRVIIEEVYQDIFGQTSEEKGGGTGFIITSDGLILTNKHVVENLRATYQVFTSDGKNYQAKVKAKDPLNDLAVLEIKGKNLPVADLGNSDDLKIGQRAIAIGNALGEFQNTVTTGVISAKERSITATGTFGQTTEELQGLIQTDASINQGNSGGPLINLDGQVVGINTVVAASAENIGFAIPINDAKTAIDSVVKTGKIIRWSSSFRSRSGNRG
jgi:serine protease Do